MAGRHVALLRGINVGTAKRVAMADLRALVEGLGYGDVSTLLNSGNVVFTVPAKAAKTSPATRIEQALEKGMRDFEHIEKDADLNSLRQDGRFVELMGRYQKG